MINLRNSLTRDWPIWLIVATFIIMATAYNTINPLHEGTDELRHYRFVQYILQNKALPVQGQEPCRSQSHHPPLFYTLGALATAGIDTKNDVCTTALQSNPFWAYRYWQVGADNKNMYLPSAAMTYPWQGEARAAHIIRFVNTLIGALTIMLTYATARIIWPDRQGYATGSAGIVAFMPMFLYMSGTINNDVIAAMSGALVIYTAVRLTHSRGINNSRNWGIAIGGTYAIALMSKFSLAPFATILGLALFITTMRRKQFQPFLITTAVTGLTTAVLAGWWFLRNYLIFGDPTGFQEVTELWGVRNPADSWGLVWLEMPNVWSSFIGRFGFGQIPLPDPVYHAMWSLTLFSLAGALIWDGSKIVIWSHYRLDPLVWNKDKNSFISLWLLFLTVLIAVVVVVAYMLVSPAGAMGRFLFPGLPAFAILLFWGWSRWPLMLRQIFATSSNTKTIIRLSTISTSAMFLFGLIALVNYLAPAYAAPAAWDILPPTATPTDAIFTFVRLEGYELQSSTIDAGQDLNLTLYWEVVSDPPGDYYFFLHLIDHLGVMTTQRDTHPLTGKFPSSQWQVGDRFVDTISLPIADTTYPTTADLSIGFYAPEGYRLPISTTSQNLLGDSFVLDQITLQTKSPTTNAGTLPVVPLNYNFENQVRLVGYTYDQRNSTDGSPVKLTLFWEAQQERFDTIKSLSVMITTPNGETTTPLPPINQLSSWTTEHLIEAPENLTDVQIAEVNIRLFDIFTQHQLNTIAIRGNWIDNEVTLSAVRFSSAP